MALYKSINGGNSWTITILRSDSGSCGTAMALDPQNSNTVHVGGYGYFYSSLDGGSTWTQKGNLTGTVQAIVVDPSASNRIFAGTAAGLYRSDNGGSTWTSKVAGSFKTIVMNPAAPNEIYAGGTSGVHASFDGGQTWTEFNAGLAFKNVLCLEWNGARKILFAGTDGGSVYSSASGVPDIFPPLDFKGTKKINRALLHAEYVIDLSWKENPQNLNIEGYRLYEVDGGTWNRLTELRSGPLEYRHRRVEKAKEYRYAVTAFRADGQEGEPAYATVR